MQYESLLNKVKLYSNSDKREILLGLRYWGVFMRKIFEYVLEKLVVFLYVRMQMRDGIPGRGKEA